jgi:ferredoxin-type protein NapH
MLYQWLRRTCLTLTLAAMLLVPLWHLGAINAEGAGLADGGRWSEIAEASGMSTITPQLLGTPWSFEILGIELLDPLAGVSLLATGSATAGVLLALLPPLLLIMLLGRFFCGWMCPYVPILAASNATRALLSKLGVDLPDIRLDRATPFVILVCVLLLTAIGGAVIAPLLYPPAIIGRQLFRAIFFGGIGAGSFVIVLAFAFDTFASRAGFCRYLCPGGALFRIIGVASPVRVRRNYLLCEDCGECVLACSLDQSPRTDGFDSGCERCGKCVAACPNNALRMTAGRPLARLIRRERPS